MIDANGTAHRYPTMWTAHCPVVYLTPGVPVLVRSP
jgi:hypothetical protein